MATQTPSRGKEIHKARRRQTGCRAQIGSKQTAEEVEGLSRRDGRARDAALELWALVRGAWYVRGNNLVEGPGKSAVTVRSGR